MAVADLVRRAIGSTPDDPEAPSMKMNPLALIVIMLTFLIFVVLMFSISYTYGHVIPTLCMIESPAAKAYMPVRPGADAPPPYTSEDEDEPNEQDSEVQLVQNQPLTTSIRATIRHLRAKAGYWSRFRGLSVFLVWNFVRSMITNIISAPFQMHPLAFAFAAIIAETLLARLHLTWVQ
jgi:hypothetical protein